MVVDTPTRWWRMLFVLRGTPLSRTWLRILLTAAWAALVTASWDRLPEGMELTTTPFSLVGVALSIFLGFRNNASYDRYWEARKLWGRLVNASRTWARQVEMLVGGDDALRRRLVERQIGYVHALRLHLRGEPDDGALAAALGADEAGEVARFANRPARIAHQTGGELRQAWTSGVLSEFHLPVLEGTLTELLALQGGCERIKATPVPWSYVSLTHRIVAIYCITLPFGLANTVHGATPWVVALIAFAFYGLDAIGEEIEQPFGHDANDLPLSALCNTIEIDLRQTLGDAPPDKARAVAGILN
jgi:putative membrane protein